MRVVHVRTVLIAAVLVFPALSIAQGTGAGFTQLEGGPERSGASPIAANPLDVRNSYRFLDPDESVMAQSNPGLVATPHGLIGVAVNETGPASEACTIVRITDPARGEVERGAQLSCTPQAAEAPAIGYAPREDLLLACSSAPTTDQVLLEARDPATGETVWSLTPAQLGVTPGSGDASAMGLVQDPTTDTRRWTCGAAAISTTDSRAVVPIWQPRTGRDRVAMLDLTEGQLIWSTSVDPSVFGPSAVSRNATGIGSSGDGAGDFLLQSVAWTRAGIVAMGEIGCQCDDEAGRATDGTLTQPFALNSAVWSAAWLTTGGEPVGGFVATETSSTEDQRTVEGQARAGSLWAASARGGSLAALALGEELVMVDPQRPSPAARVDLVTSEPVRGLDLFVWPGPAWHQDTILVPLLHSVSAYDASDLVHRWTWMESLSWQVADIHIDPPGTAYALLARNQTSQNQARLVEIDTETGRQVRQLPLPIHPVFQDTSDRIDFFTGLWSARLLPVDDGQGLLVIDTNGTAVHLAEAPDAIRPDLGLSSDHPEPGQPVQITPTTKADGVTSFAVSWGNGTVEQIEPGGTAQHVYPSPGREMIRVTAVYPDGTTATRQRTIDVGGEELSLMQRVFAPENQDMTFGVLGIAVALFGGVVGVARRRRRKSRLADELDELRAIREQGAEDPAAGVEALLGYRRSLHAKLADGDIGEAQFGTLTDEVSRLSRRLRKRALAPYRALTDTFRERLEAALEDGVLTPTERDELLDALEDEPVDAGQADELEALLERWGRLDS